MGGLTKSRIGCCATCLLPLDDEAREIDGRTIRPACINPRCPSFREPRASVAYRDATLGRLLLRAGLLTLESISVRYWRVAELTRPYARGIRGVLLRDWARSAYRARLQWLMARLPASVIYFASIQMACDATFTKEGGDPHGTMLMDAIKTYGDDHGIH